MNGLISETDSIVHALLLILNAQYKTAESYAQDERLTTHLLNVIGLLVVVPSNPEAYYFTSAQAILNMVGKKQWQRESLFLKTKVMCGLINYLCT